MLMAQRVRPGPAGECAADVMPYDQMIAHSGYNSEANHRCRREEPGVDGLIRSLQASLRHRGRYHALPAGDDQAAGQASDLDDRAACCQRWKALTVMSLVKGRCGKALSARLEPTQQAQALRRGIAYHVQRLAILGYAP